MPPQSDLLDWKVVDPDNRIDNLPAPYSFIVEVLNQTVLHNLNLQLFRISTKQLDPNYESKVKEYVASNTFDLDGICTLSNAKNKDHNILVAGDRASTIYLLDLPKRTVVSKRQLTTDSRQITSISQLLLTDGDQKLVRIAVTLNRHPQIYLLSYSLDDPKLLITHTINLHGSLKMVYAAQLHDYGRLLTAKTYQGTLIGWNIPDINIKLPQSNNSIRENEQQLKKLLKFSLNYVQKNVSVDLNDKNLAFQIKFEGYQPPKKFKDLLGKLKEQSEPSKTVQPVDPKKQPSKDSKKTNQPPTPIITESQNNTPALLFNKPFQQTALIIENGLDMTCLHPKPQFEPFFITFNGKVDLPKKKYFEKTKCIPVLQKAIIGWTNTKQFILYGLRLPSINSIPNHIWSSFFCDKSQKKPKQSDLKLIQQKKFKNIFEVTCKAISDNQNRVAFGMIDGSIAIWDIKAGLIEYNSDRHSGAVNHIKFFECWKIISGSINGTVHIDNIITHHNQVKRTHIFQPKTNIPICSIQVNLLGIAFVLDFSSNLRIYDLWRNEKICRLSVSSVFSTADLKSKLWAVDSTSVFTCWDFTVLISSQPSKITKNSESSATGTSSLLHIIRNFELLLTLFEGLQTTYKRGYERKKVQNLYSNLEYTQLNDRQFLVPDFGRSTNDLKNSNTIITTRSKIGLQIKNQSIHSRNSQKPSISSKNGTNSIHQNSDSTGPKAQKTVHFSKKGNSQHNKTSGFSNTVQPLSSTQANIINRQTTKVNLTNEVLHPQKFLLQRRKIPGEVAIDQTTLLETIRAQHAAKARREHQLQQQLSHSVL